MEYELYAPGGNTTALIYEPVHKSQRALLAQRLLGNARNIEQVGFIEPAQAPEHALRLSMMGGELCVHAALCAAAGYFRTSGNDEATIELDDLPHILVQANRRGEAVSLLFPASVIVDISTLPDGHRVDLQGIRYLVHTAPVTEESIRERIFSHLEPQFPAVGLIQLSCGENLLSIEPHIFVRETESLVHESACGSGSIAAAAVAHLVTGAAAHTILQPSGAKAQVAITEQEVSYALPVPYLGAFTF